MSSAFIYSKLDTFKDKDLVDEDAKSEIEEDLSLTVLTNDVTMVKQRQAAIMNMMQDQMNILKVVASKVGAGAHQEVWGSDRAPREAIR